LNLKGLNLSLISKKDRRKKNIVSDKEKKRQGNKNSLIETRSKLLLLKMGLPLSCVQTY